MPSTVDITSMFMLGLLGNGHCVGMCGPIVASFSSRSGVMPAHLAYHSGRIITYAFIGAVLGAIGGGLGASSEGAQDLAWLSWLQMLLTLVAANFLLYFGLARLGFFPEPKFMNQASPGRFPGFQKIGRRVYNNQGLGAFFIFGLMLGFLPCGLSYAAFTRALPSGGFLDGGLLALAFALGTLPGLLLIGTSAAGIYRKYQKVSEYLSGMLMIGMGASILMDILQIAF